MTAEGQAPAEAWPGFEKFDAVQVGAWVQCSCVHGQASSQICRTQHAHCLMCKKNNQDDCLFVFALQELLDSNAMLISQINANHQTRTPEALARNVELIQELNANIGRVVELYQQLAATVVDEGPTQANNAQQRVPGSMPVQQHPQSTGAGTR